MIVLEGICTILGLVQGVLVAINKRSNWIFYILQMLGLLIFSFLNHLYGDVANNAIYLIIGIIGFIRWGKEEKSQITACKRRERIIYIGVLAIATFLVFSFLKNTDDPLPLIDSFTTVSSFVATYYMVMKKIDTWIIWFINDILYVIEYFMLPNQAVMLGVLNIVWTGLAVCSFINWRRLMKKGVSIS